MAPAVPSPGPHASSSPRSAARQSMRMAAIDVGSNSIHMIVAEAAVDGGITTLWRMKEMVQLGQASFGKGAIARPTIDRALAVLARFQQAAQQRQCEKIVAVATSAVREASNGGDFIQRIRRQLHLDVRVVSGREEARLIYLGVRHAMDLGQGDLSLIVDIGGGSVEFILADNRHATLLQSRKLGASRITAALISSDPISADDESAVRHHYDQELGTLFEEILRHKPVRAIGTSGTLESLAMLCAQAGESDGAPAPASIERSTFAPVLETLLKSDSKSRAQMKGLDPARKDQIIAGALLVDEIFARLKFRRIQMCSAALREGILVDYLSHHLPDLAIRRQLPNPRPRSVIALARRCAWHKTHSEQVARLATRLFDQTRALHGLGTPERELIEYAALLHDIGWHIGRSGHHKHSMYLIRHGDLKNFSAEEIEIIANIARYHRKAIPKAKHPAYAALSPRGKKVVEIGAALLRLADGLDRSHASVVKDLKCRSAAKEVKCTIQTRWDAQLELWGATRKRELFEKVFKRPILFEVASEKSGR